MPFKKLSTLTITAFPLIIHAAGEGSGSHPPSRSAFTPASPSTSFTIQTPIPKNPAATAATTAYLLGVNVGSLNMAGEIAKILEISLQPTDTVLSILYKIAQFAQDLKEEEANSEEGTHGPLAILSPNNPPSPQHSPLGFDVPRATPMRDLKDDDDEDKQLSPSSPPSASSAPSRLRSSITPRHSARTLYSRG